MLNWLLKAHRIHDTFPFIICYLTHVKFFATAKVTNTNSQNFSCILLLWKELCNAYRSQFLPGKSSPLCSPLQRTLLWRRDTQLGCCVEFYTTTLLPLPVSPHTLLQDQSLACPLPATPVPAGSGCGVGLSAQPGVGMVETYYKWEKRKWWETSVAGNVDMKMRNESWS